MEVDDPLGGLDIGVAAATLSISAARCIPFSSCNGGAFGGHHNERYPLVAFCMRRQMERLFQEIASEAGVGLWQHDYGEVSVYGPGVPTLMSFAKAMHARRREFGAIRLRP